MPPSLLHLIRRGSTEGLSDDGIVQLSSLHGLTELRILPLGLAVTRLVSQLQHLVLGACCSVLRHKHV